MLKELIDIENIISGILSNIPTNERTQNAIKNYIETMNNAHFKQKMNRGMTDQEITTLFKRLETIHTVTMDDPEIFDSIEYRPWLDDKRSKIDWYYWDRYKKYLNYKKFPKQVINSLDLTTDKILDRCEDPLKKGIWDRKGMVVGNVQSGKTANYTGLITKAADSGYRIIIVFAGMLNSLRSQTQERIDEGFIGFNSCVLNSNISNNREVIGVGKFCNERYPHSLTDYADDFKTAKVNSVLGIRLKSLIDKDPIVLVIKKNVSSLKNVQRWFESNSEVLSSHPLLVIDDEADQASLNTNKKECDPTSINKGIRELLSIFQKSTFIGYTATPFANIFIDEEEKDDIESGHSLFPKDFIINIDPPSNYIGPQSIFSDNSSLNDMIQEISLHDEEVFLEENRKNHKKDFEPEYLPDSLNEAIISFLIIQVIRELRGQHNCHNSMLINISRFTQVQTIIKEMVFDYIYKLRNSIKNYYCLKFNEFIENDLCNDIYNVWFNKFQKSGEEWSQIQPLLNNAIQKTTVIEVNGSKSSDDLDYSNYHNGRAVIAVGGIKLSRGITLEGLTVSYFLRNSKMYDTLMQMGRWFGYRPDYEDLCRLYITDEAYQWYKYITESLEELREDFAQIPLKKKTPETYGLKVRNHPETLLVTALNKMRSGKKVKCNIDLSGKLVETTSLRCDSYSKKTNSDAFKRLISAIDKKYKIIKSRKRRGYYCTDISMSYLTNFLSSFSNYEECLKTDPISLINHFEIYNDIYKDGFDLLIYTKQDHDSFWDLGNDIVIPLQKRKVRYKDNVIFFNNSRIASRGIEKYNLDPEVSKKIEDDYVKKNLNKNIPDKEFRAKFKRPLLMLHILDCEYEYRNEVKNIEIIAWGLSFPNHSANSISKPVEYMVNTIWWKNNFSFIEETDEE